MESLLIDNIEFSVEILKYVAGKLNHLPPTFIMPIISKKTNESIIDKIKILYKFSIKSKKTLTHLKYKCNLILDNNLFIYKLFMDKEQLSSSSKDKIEDVKYNVGNSWIALESY